MIKKFSRIAEQSFPISIGKQASKQKKAIFFSLSRTVLVGNGNGKGRLLFNVKYIKKLCSALFTSKKPATKSVLHTKKWFQIYFCCCIVLKSSPPHQLHVVPFFLSSIWREQPRTTSAQPRKENCAQPFQFFLNILDAVVVPFFYMWYRWKLP